MDKTVAVLDFDDCYQNQVYYKKAEYKEINMMDLKNVSRYCDRLTLDELNQRINKLKESSVTYIGNGNYHYVTYLLVKNIDKPFTLIVFDHHTDMMESPDKDIISCGSWIRNALCENSFLKKVIVVGVMEELCDTIPDEFKDKVCIITESELFDYEKVIKKLEKAVCTECVYISIDKDVLDYSDAATNWDQGTLKLKDLTSMLKDIYLKNKVCGIDICGEYSCSPSEEFCMEAVNANRKNDGANRAILNEIENI